MSILKAAAGLRSQLTDCISLSFELISLNIYITPTEDKRAELSERNCWRFFISCQCLLKALLGYETFLEKIIYTIDRLLLYI